MADVDRTAEVARLRERFADSVAAINADSDLSDEGRERRIRELREQTNTRIAAVRDAELAEVAGDADELERQLLSRPLVGFGASELERMAAAQGFRDASDRAAAADDGRLVEIMRDAARTGDTLQLRAGLAQALRTMNVDAVNVYVEKFPSDEADLQRIFDLRARSPRRLLRDQLDAAMRFGSV